MNDKSSQKIVDPDPNPLVSVGLTAYSSAHLYQALESLTTQTYDNLEIIVSDDYSPDEEVAEIVKRFMANDPRVGYWRQEENLGEVANSNFVVGRASGEYFMWASDNDIWDREYVKCCLEVLLRSPTVVLCYSRAQVIDNDGNLGDMERDNVDTYGLGTTDRVKRILWRLSRCTAFHGLMRVEALRNTHLCRMVWGADHVLLAELALEGAFVQIQERLFYRRIPQESDEQSHERHMQNIYGGKKNRFPLLRMTLEHLRMLSRSRRVNYVERGRLILSLLSAFNERFGKRIRRELINAVTGNG